MPPAGERDADRIEQRAFDEDRRGGFVAAGGLAADHAGHRLHAGRIGDRAILRRDRVVLAVQRAERLAAPGPQRQHVAGELRHVEDMQRTAEIDGEEIGDVDQRVDRPQTDRGQPVLQPLRARPVAHVADGAAEDPWTGLGPVDLPARAAAERGRHLARLPRLQRADAGGGEIARDAAHGKAVAAVGRDADIDHRVVEPGPLRVGHADRRILRQVDDAGVVVAQAHLARGQQHARAAHAADFADLQRGVGAGNEAAGRGEHALHAGARIRRAAHHEHRVVAGVHLADAQPIGVGVLHRLDDARDAERRQRRAAILHAFQFQADAGQRVGDLGRAWRRSRRCVFSQERENFIAHAPSCSIVGASGLKTVVAQPADVGFEERPQVGDAVLQHGDALDAHAPGEALPLARIDAAVRQHARMHHAAAEDLQPVAAVAEFAGAAVPADIDLHRRLGEREVAGAEPHRQVGDAEEGAQEVDQRALQMAERQVAIEDQALALVEHRRVRRVMVGAIGAADDDDADRRRLRQHGADLHRRGLRAQHRRRLVALRRQVERVVVGARRVVRRECSARRNSSSRIRRRGLRRWCSPWRRRSPRSPPWCG